MSRGTVDLLAPLVDLPEAATALIRTVVVSSAGEFGRVVIGPADLGPQPLGLTIRYGDLLEALNQACESDAYIELRRSCRLVDMMQQPGQVLARLHDGTSRNAAVLIHAEGMAPITSEVPSQAALIADVSVAGPPQGHAYERFTREGPLALLPLPGGTAAEGRSMALVWCMPAAAAQRRLALDDAAFIQELQQAFGPHSGRIVRVGARNHYFLHEQARDVVREHRVVWIGNAAQTLHPVAGQGLNLGMRDAAQLADALAQALADGRDPSAALGSYELQRGVDRRAIRALTRRLPALFATRAGPFALGRSVALTALNAFPDARRQFARLLMFGVRA
jgi:2-octaprenyl-6-methoxyphenol hydroxylase